MDVAVAGLFFVLMLLTLVFSFVAITVWLQYRRKEREAFYQNETVKKLADSAGGHTSVLEFLRDKERRENRRWREQIKLAGLIVGVTGVALLIFLSALIPQTPIYLVALIPLLVGGALLVYAYGMAPGE